MACTLVGAKEIAQRLSKAENIILTAHVNPDGDALGSMLAMYLYLKEVHKNVEMVIDDKIASKYLELPHVADIKKSIDIHWDKIDLLLIVDASTSERLPIADNLVANTHILNIDHHISNTKYADELYLDVQAAATGEIIVDLFKAWDYKATPTIANLLYLAIATDCGFFKYPNTTAKTIDAAKYCLECGAMPEYVSRLVDSYTKNRLEGLRLAMDSIKYFKDDRLAIVVADRDLMDLVDEDTDAFIDLIRNVQGVQISLLFKEYAPDFIKVSLRSNIYDVNALASQFGGGGHIRAAGCTLRMPLSEAIAKVVARAEEVLDRS